MPFFFIAPIWLLCVIVGLLMTISGRLRFLASYLILGSTFGLLASLVVSSAVLVLFGRFEAMTETLGSLGGIAAILGYVAGIAVGGVAGIVGGVLAAHRVNRWVGLSKAN